MSVKVVEVDVISSLDNFLMLALGIAQDLKAGKTVAAILADAVPALEVALQNMGDFSADLANKAALENTIALKLAQFVQALSA
jgi:hypothetical protein